MNYSSTLLQHFTWYISLDVLFAFLVWAIKLSHGFSPALLKISEKHRDTVTGFNKAKGKNGKMAKIVCFSYNGRDTGVQRTNH